MTSMHIMNSRAHSYKISTTNRVVLGQKLH